MGDVNRMEDNLARARVARFTRAELIAQPRETAGSARRFYGARTRFARTRLVATDCDWSAGDGERELHGPVGDLLLVATGRQAGLAALSGSAVDRVAAAL